MSGFTSEPDQRRFDAGGPSLGDLGEVELLRQLLDIARETDSHDLELAAGDDAAVWRPAPGRHLAVSQDAIVEGEDFRRDWTTPRQVGRKAVAVAMSDLAGMGAEPAWCLITLCAPAATDADDLLEIQRGLCEGAAASGCAVAGGDVSDIDGPLVIDVSVAGTLPPGRAIRRDGGRPGDALVVTGALGRAAAGLRLLSRHGGAAAPDSPDAARWVQAQVEPEARIAEGQLLLESGVDAGGDLSDGLLADTQRLAAASGCAAELWLDTLPVDPSIREQFGTAWVELAIGDGEDFELLVAIRSDRVSTLLRDWPRELAPLHVIGRLVPGDGVRVLERQGGSMIAPPPIRSRHYG